MVQITGSPSLKPVCHFSTFFSTGSYTQTGNEKYEEFLKKLNVGFILRKAAMASTPVMTIAEVKESLVSQKANFNLLRISLKRTNIAPNNQKFMSWSDRRAATGRWSRRPPSRASSWGSGEMLSSSMFRQLLRNDLLTSRLGEEFEETTTDGRKCKTTVKLFSRSGPHGLLLDFVFILQSSNLKGCLFLWMLKGSMSLEWLETWTYEYVDNDIH